jgi:hypothetical protein
MAYTLSQSVDDSAPSIVLVGVPSQKALERVISKLQSNNIEHSAFYESDDDMGLTAVATVPLGEGQRQCLRGYKLWRPEQVSHAASSVVRAPSSQEDGGHRFESCAAYQVSPLNSTFEDRFATGVGVESTGHGDPGM